MQFFRKKFKTDESGGVYYRRMYFLRPRYNPWGWGGCILVSSKTHWLGFSLAWPFFRIEGKGSPVRNAKGSKHRILWWGKGNAAVWQYGIGLQRSSDRDVYEWGCQISFFIKDFIIGIATDRGTWKIYFGFWSVGTRTIRWMQGWNDHEFPTTEYGRFCLSIPKKKLKQFMEVNKRLEGVAPCAIDVSFDGPMTAGVAPSIPQSTISYPPSYTAFIK